ncbi:hypothetical protein FHX77_000007 [Bifidobacterium commune]|uniref:hypothetical protein n=1 Tax=Bifidobacterium commune TaxID=1505727 RepID=UPI001606BF9C|nr:hypothetical protein [Bifidobacterium commune]MBB2954627.1 hypothetical protein [Bifidobacterium commune]
MDSLTAFSSLWQNTFNYHEDDDERALIARRYRGTTSLAASHRLSAQDATA